MAINDLQVHAMIWRYGHLTASASDARLQPADSVSASICLLSHQHEHKCPPHDIQTHCLQTVHDLKHICTVGQGKQTQDFFLTARNSIGVWFIGWSFYAATLGSWAVFSIPSYAYTAGIFVIVAAFQDVKDVSRSRLHIRISLYLNSSCSPEKA